LTPAEVTRAVDAWLANATPWVSPADPMVGQDNAKTGEPAVVVHPHSTNADHTGLRSRLDQYRLPRHRTSAA
jgi:hypothetical protein